MYLTFVSKYLIIQLNIWAVCAVLRSSALLECTYRVAVNLSQGDIFNTRGVHVC